MAKTKYYNNEIVSIYFSMQFIQLLTLIYYFEELHNKIESNLLQYNFVS